MFQPEVQHPDSLPVNDVSAQYPLNSLSSDASQILAFLEEAKQQYLRVPFIREFTVNLLSGLDNNDQVGQVNRVIDFVRQNVTYVQDPTDSEYVISPVQMLDRWQRTHSMYGDCDDHVLLLNTMLGTIGIPTKFIGVKFGNSDVYNHVISGVELEGQLFQVDPCAKGVRQPQYADTLIL